MTREKIILERIAGKHVLDIGSVGQTDHYRLWTLYPSANPASLTGIDLPEAETTVKNSFGLAYNSGSRDARIVFGNMETYKFDRKFDVIIAGDVIEHVENQGLFLRNILDHLEPDGKFILTTPNAKSLTVIPPPNPTHTLWHDRYTLEYLLKKCGFRVDSISYYLGNKKNYPLLVRPLVWRQGLLAMCSKSR